MTEMDRRAVLEHPELFNADERADAWEMTAGQCRERGPMFDWAAKIASEEALKARAQSRSRVKETR